MLRHINRRTVLGMLVASLAAAQNKKSELKVLVVCSGNSCRSQMAEGFLKSFDSRLKVQSAGTHPAKAVHPYAVRVMQEAGIDLKHQHPKQIKQFIGDDFDYVITVCDQAAEECPNFIGKVGKKLHLGFADPAKAHGPEAEVLEVFRKSRDEIKAGFRKLYDEELKPLLG